MDRAQPAAPWSSTTTCCPGRALTSESTSAQEAACDGVRCRPVRRARPRRRAACRTSPPPGTRYSRCSRGACSRSSSRTRGSVQETVRLSPRPSVDRGARSRTATRRARLGPGDRAIRTPARRRAPAPARGRVPPRAPGPARRAGRPRPWRHAGPAQGGSHRRGPSAGLKARGRAGGFGRAAGTPGTACLRVDNSGTAEERPQGDRQVNSSARECWAGLSGRRLRSVAARTAGRSGRRRASAAARARGGVPSRVTHRPAAPSRSGARSAGPAGLRLPCLARPTDRPTLQLPVRCARRGLELPTGRARPEGQ